jgi:hypothetical protein
VRYTSDINCGYKNQLIDKVDLSHLLSLGYIDVTVEEIYGSLGNANYRPLSDAYVKAIGESIFVRKNIYEDYTDENGKALLNGMIPGLYRVRVSKSNYRDISSGSLQYRIIDVQPNGQTVKYILAENGSPWIKQRSFDGIQIFSFQLILNYLFKY